MTVQLYICVPVFEPLARGRGREPFSAHCSRSSAFPVGHMIPGRSGRNGAVRWLGGPTVSSQTKPSSFRSRGSNLARTPTPASAYPPPPPHLSGSSLRKDPTCMGKFVQTSRILHLGAPPPFSRIIGNPAHRNSLVKPHDDSDHDTTSGVLLPAESHHII